METKPAAVIAKLVITIGLGGKGGCVGKNLTHIGLINYAAKVTINKNPHKVALYYSIFTYTNTP